MKKRVLALFLTLVMAVSVLSVGAFADVRAYDDKDTAINDTSVTANKTVSGPDVDGNYTITISVKGSTTTVPGVNNLPADIVLVVDTSTSMNDTATTKVCGGELKESTLGYRCVNCHEWYLSSEAARHYYICPNIITDQTRLDIAKAAASQFASGLMSASDAVRMGVYDFSGSNRTNIALTGDKTAVTSAVEDLDTPIRGDGTDYGLGLNGAANILEDSEEGRQKFVVFISDGEPNNGDYGTEKAKELMEDGVTIMTVGVDMDSSGMRYLRNISSSDDSGDSYCYSASSDGSSGDALDAVLALIQEKIETSINSGTDAVLTDTINTADFNLVEGSQSEDLAVSGNVLTWSIGDICSEEQTVSFKVKPVAGKYGELHTNSDVRLSFYSTQQSVNVIFYEGAIGDPTVTIDKPTAGYTVNYYKDSLDNKPFNTATGEGNVGDEIPYDTATNKPEGYKLDSVTPDDPIISSDDDNVVSVLYVKDETATKVLSYTVEYYKDGVKVEDDTQTVTEEIWIGSSQNTLMVKKDGINITNKYDGFVFDYTDPTAIPDNIENNGIIKVYYTSVEPDAPTAEDLAALKLEVHDLGVHPNGDYAIEDGTFKTDVKLVNGEWQCALSVEGSAYLAKYNAEFGKHGFSGSSTKTKTLVYGAAGWTLENPSNDCIVFDVRCVEPDAPTYDVLKDMIKVQIDCINKEVSHSNADYDLIESSYDLGTLTANADGTWSCTLTVKSDAYIAKYNETLPGHTLADAYASKNVALKWTGSAWTVINGELPVTFDVVCDTWYPPIIPPVAPSEPVYRPNWLNTTDHFGYIIGYEDGTIKPNASITRAEVATIFFRLLTDEARESHWTETNSYSDVAETAWYNNAVSTLSRMGILGGYEDGTFRPNASITRAEFAKIAVSFFEYEDISAENIFTDVAAGSWYENFVAVAAKLGLIEGYAGNVYRPNESITRAEACTIINRTLGRAPDADHLLPESQMNTWPDNRPGTWYYAQLQEATNSHEYKWSGDIEIWTEKLPERDWDALQR